MIRHPNAPGIMPNTLDKTIAADGAECKVVINGVEIVNGVVSDASGDLYEALFELAYQQIGEGENEE